MRASHGIELLSIFKRFLTLIFVAQGCDDHDMLKTPILVRNVQIKKMIPFSGAHPFVITPIFAIPTNS